MLSALFVHMLKGLCNHILNQILRYIQVQLPAHQPGNGKKIFHNVDQPHGILINVCVQPLFRLLVQIASHGQQVSGIA